MEMRSRLKPGTEGAEDHPHHRLEGPCSDQPGAPANGNRPSCLVQRSLDGQGGLNDNTDPNDTFGGKTVTADLLANERKRQELKGRRLRAADRRHRPARQGSLRTNPAVGLDNIVSTTICFPGSR